MRYHFYTADVFTQQIFGGNQLAVFPQAAGLSDLLMQQIAREFNLSETVFVLPPADPAHTCRLRIFTPGSELPFAGHPTVGTAFVLASLGMVQLEGERTAIIFEEGVGPVPVTIFATEGQPQSAQLTAAVPPSFGPSPTVAGIAAMVGLDEGDILSDNYSPQAASCGVPFLFAPLRDRVALARAHLNPARWQEALAGSWAPHLYLICFDPELPGSQLRARMFAPAMGITEDPATGAAAAALGGYLGVREQQATGTFRWVVEQGFEMGRPSLIEVEADKEAGTVTSVRVGGAAVMVSEGTMTVG